MICLFTSIVLSRSAKVPKDLNRRNSPDAREHDEADDDAKTRGREESDENATYDRDDANHAEARYKSACNKHRRRLAEHGPALWIFRELRSETSWRGALDAEVVGWLLATPKLESVAKSLDDVANHLTSSSSATAAESERGCEFRV